MPRRSAASAPASVSSTAIAAPNSRFISTSPFSGGGIDRDKVPALVQTVTSEDISRTYSQNITETLFQYLPGVSTSDQQGNSFQTDIRYRGFVASPVPGQPQGLAVYMNGVRVNEAFGDTVNFDFLPGNAIARADLQSNNPVFGLNALGGAINLQMKNGFTYRGSEAELQGGSFGTFTGAAQTGLQLGDDAVYFAAQGLHQGGWRFQSTADYARLFADLGRRTDRGEFHLIAAGATSSLGVAAATPIQLLDLDDRAVFTTPQTTKNHMGLLGLNGNYALTDTWSLQGNLYVRGFNQNHLDGNVPNTERCRNSASPQF